MTLYAAYARPDTSEVVCLPERFNWFAFLLPPVWALTHALWWELLSLVAGVVVIALTAGYFGVPFAPLYLIGAIWFGLEANHLHGRALLRKGYVERGSLSAADRIGAEMETASRLGMAVPAE